ncbi:MAG TPA: NfeD family protein [Gaiellaceae bacterium]|nr:NfeD family protein [Gaiellaceae bacterium]
MFLILAFVLLIFLPSPWGLVAFTICLVLFVGELLFWNRTMRGRRKVVGAQTLVGQQAEVTAPCRPVGQVRIGGEIWEARCDAGVDTGETVRVVEVRGLTLLVEPV